MGLDQFFFDDNGTELLYFRKNYELNKWFLREFNPDCSKYQFTIPITPETLTRLQDFVKQACPPDMFPDVNRGMERVEKALQEGHPVKYHANW